MSQNRKLTSLVSVFALLGVAGLLGAACGGGGGGDGDASCGEISGRVSALQDSAAALTTVSASIRTDVVSACAQIAGMSAPANATDDDVTRLCNAAKAKVDATITGSVRVVVVPPVCNVNAMAQVSCEADCYAEAEVDCDPGEVNVRCDPGELSVSCSGTCNVNAYCEGSATVAVDCQGECQGSCEGTCSGSCSGTCEGTCMGSTNSDGSCNGTCNGTCKGECSANCTGKCSGSCKVTAMGGVSCGANARCKGGCTGTATAPKCEANLKPPSCEASANVDCSADCQSSASLQAECTDPSVDIVGNIDAQVKADFKAALPKLLKVTGKGELALDAVGDLAEKFRDVGGSVTGCALQLGSVAAEFGAAVTATAKASASVSVSFEASASVSGSATAG